MKKLLTPIVFFISLQLSAQEMITKDLPDGRMTLNKAGASYFANLSLHCTGSVYPHYYHEELRRAEDLQPPEKLWPSFYGCFDWHSCVHNHWALVKLLKTYPDIPEAAAIRAKLEESFSANNILQEVEYFKKEQEPDDIYSFEFPYGTSWLLKVADELIRWDNEDAKRWLGNLQPLTDYITAYYVVSFPQIDDAVYYGNHYSTAFGLSFAIDYARSANNTGLELVLTNAAKKYYLDYTDFAINKEPFNYDFMSAGLLIADLMRKVLDEDAYAEWLQKFAPDLFTEEGAKKVLAVKKIDMHTGYAAHWDGYQLNRIWCLNGMLEALPKKVLSKEVKEVWVTSEKEMWEYAQQSIGKGNYDIDHWLSSFSVFAMTGY